MKHFTYNFGQKLASRKHGLSFEIMSTSRSSNWSWFIFLWNFAYVFLLAISTRVQNTFLFVIFLYFYWFLESCRNHIFLHFSQNFSKIRYFSTQTFLGIAKENTCEKCQRKAINYIWVRDPWRSSFWKISSRYLKLHREFFMVKFLVNIK